MHLLPPSMYAYGKDVCADRMPTHGKNKMKSCLLFLRKMHLFLKDF